MKQNMDFARAGIIIKTGWLRSGAFLCACLLLTLFCWTGGQSVKADTVIGTVPAGSGPNAVAVNPETNKIYVANQTSNNVTVIDGTNNSTTTVAVGTFPVAVAVNSVTNKIYVANADSNNITVIDGGNNSTTTVAVGTFPAGVAVNPVTNKIYVANGDSNNVTVIDGGNNSTTTVAVGSAPRAVEVNLVTNKIYVANQLSGNVTVIDGSDNSTTTVAVGTFPIAAAVNSATNKIYVANADSNNVTVIDGGNNSTTTVSAGSIPVAVAVNSVTNKIYVANQLSGNVTVIDGSDNSTTTVAVGSTPVAVAVNSVTNKIYVANADSNNVTVIDGGNNSTTTVSAGSQPNAVAVNSVTNKIYVANLEDNNVTVIDGTPTPGGIEADVAVRPNGNGAVQSDDVVQIRRFLNATNTPDPATNEFQRADSSPFAEKGDGNLNSADVVQTRRYQNGTNPLQTAGGPTLPNEPQALTDEFNKTEARSKSPEGNPREVRVESTTTSVGQTMTVNIRVDTVGDEAEYAFILDYDRTTLSNPVIGAGTAGATVRACNTKVAGVINCSVGGFPNNNPMSSDAGIGEIGAGDNQILITVKFMVAAKTPSGATPLALSNVNASNDAPQLSTPRATGDMVTILGPTAARVLISERVWQTNRRGVMNGRVELSDQNGDVRSERLSPKISSYEWRVFNANVSLKEAIGEIILIHHKNIGDGYSNNLTIRKFTIEEQPSNLLFNSLKIILAPLNTEIRQMQFGKWRIELSKKPLKM